MPLSQTFLAAVAAAIAATPALADLRGACTPQKSFTIINSGSVRFNSTFTMSYCEPSTFNYAGLATQKTTNYDNFLRSNIDNEQDKRAFETEDGKDMLPFRTLESTGACGITLTALTPGVEKTFPLRWNNPHASEIEANVWLLKVTPPVVVPVTRPVCSGEGCRDSVVGVTVPADFNTKVRSLVPGFTGCLVEGDCVLQLYAHSVETRTYAIGIPISISGYDASVTAATDFSGVLPAPQDVGYNLAALPRDTCLSQADASAKVTSAAPQYARLVSDVANHAYQNSNFSPYQGQQATSISRNLQAASIIRMVTGNRGELGKTSTQGRNGIASVINSLAANATAFVNGFEKAADEVITKVGEVKLKNQGVVSGQTTATCFRCVEKACVQATRINTQTYIPSFKIDTSLVTEARNAVGDVRYKSVVRDDGSVLIYQSALDYLYAQFKAAEAKGVYFLPAVIKTTLGTMSDPVNFKKVDSTGTADTGKYAAAAFAAARPSASVSPSPSVGAAASASPSAVPTPLPSSAVAAALDDDPSNDGEIDPDLSANPDDSDQMDDEEDGSTEEVSSASTIAASLSAAVISAVAAVALF